MRLVPEMGERSAHWSDESPRGPLTLAVWTERKEGNGEDADPAVLYHAPSGHGLLAVSDGVGGAGVQIAGRTADGTARTGAWIASRIVRLAVEHWFVEMVTRRNGAADEGGSADRANPRSPKLIDVVRDALAQVRGASRSRIQGTMQREYPATLALIDYAVRPDGVWVGAEWAGDSRCYLLSADEGLQQISVDDTELQDALESMTQDPPMTNRISADGKFVIHYREVAERMASQFIALCATDGFFNYTATPAHFEYVLLDTLHNASSMRHWAQLLIKAVHAYTQDDATLALAAFGFDQFVDLQTSFGRRRALLLQDHVVPLRELESGDAAAFEAARADSWARYRDGYERRMSTGDGGMTGT